MKDTTCSFSQSASFPNSSAMSLATAGAISIAARASRNRARVLLASTSSMVLAISYRVAQTTSAPIYGSFGSRISFQAGFSFANLFMAGASLPYTNKGSVHSTDSRYPCRERVRYQVCGEVSHSSIARSTVSSAIFR